MFSRRGIVRPAAARSARRVGFSLCVALFAVAPAAVAQEVGDVVGRVLVAGTESGVGAALVQVVESGARVPADADGRFHVPKLGAGTVTLRVTAVGYSAAESSVLVRSGERTTVRIELQIQPLQMAGIEVTVLRPDLRRLSEMERQAVRELNPRDPGELLREVSGVDAARRGPLGLDPNVQGLVETEVASFIDGERRFPAGPGRMDSPLTHVDALAFRKITVVKGPYALAWGAGSLSSIRVDTESLPPERPGPLHGNLTAGYDSNVNGVETAGGLVGRSGAVSYWGFGAYRQGDDYRDGNGDTVEGDYESWEGRGKLAVEPSAGSRLVLGGGYQSQGPIDYPGRILDADFFHTWNASGSYTLDGRSAAFGGLRVEAYANETDHDMTNELKPSAAMSDVNVETSTRVLGGRAAASLAADGWEFEVGGDVYSTRRRAVRQIRNPVSGMLMLEDLIWPDVNTTAGGIFARGDRAFTGALDLSGTLRLDLAGSTADTVSEWFASNVSNDLSTSSTDVSGAVTLGVHLSPNWTLFAGAGSAVRTPDASELYADRFPSSKSQFAAEFVGNPELSPERSTQLDVGFEGSQSRVTIQANVFARNVADYITLELTDFDPKLPISPDNVYRYVNGDAVFWGAEAAVAVLLGRNWTVHARTDYLWGEDRELDEPAIGIIPWRGAVGLRYELPDSRFHGEATLKLVADQNRVAESRGEVPTEGYTVANLRFGWQLTSQLLLRFGVQNLGDRYYVNHLNATDPFTGDRIAEPGRVVYVNLGASF